MTVRKGRAARLAASVRRTLRSPRVRKAALAVLLAVIAFYLYCGLALLYLRSHPPLFTAVQLKRRIESWFSSEVYEYRSQWRPLSEIPVRLQRAVVAAEDGAFRDHSGVDWAELGKVWSEWRADGKRLRGASTITQQLVKNLFLTTSRSPLRKALEYTLAPAAEWILGKERILELYLNVIEWGPGVWGAEAAARYHYQKPVGRLSRRQAARLAACIPAPRSRRPERMDEYSAIILERMRSRGW